MNYRINYNVVLFNEILYDKEIKVKNKDNELMAKCSLEDYLRRKHGDAFRQLIITKCVPEYFNDRLFNGIFGGMIVDNFEYLSKLFDELIDKDDFYFVQIIQRKKDGVELPS